MNGKGKNFFAWVIEFSKITVIVCVLIYVANFIYSAVVMWIYMDLTALPTLITEGADVLKTCVFGYMIKAALENVQKIKGAANTAPENEYIGGPKG